MTDSQKNKDDSQTIRSRHIVDVTCKECTKDILTYLAQKYPKNPLLNKYRDNELLSQEDNDYLDGSKI